MHLHYFSRHNSRERGRRKGRGGDRTFLRNSCTLVKTLLVFNSFQIPSWEDGERASMENLLHVNEARSDGCYYAEVIDYPQCTMRAKSISKRGSFIP